MKYKHTVRTLYKLNRAEKKDIQNKHFKNVMLMEEPETVETLVPQAELPEPELPEEPQSELAAEPMQKPKKKKSAAVITATIIFIVGIIFAIIYFSNNTDNYSYDILPKHLQYVQMIILKVIMKNSEVHMMPHLIRLIK